ncbi:MAG: hypothetical protein WC841_02635 [Candidatus Shapirobacteria bacterium]|jgi:hypothetical protein
MIFKNPSQSASLLAQKIIEEGIAQSSLITYIDSDDKNYCQQIADNLSLKLEYLPNLIRDKFTFALPNLIIADSGQTRGQEYNEFTDLIRKIYPTIRIYLAIPVIPLSEEEVLKQACDSLITLHVEPLFFSLDQFYEISP